MSSIVTDQFLRLHFANLLLLMWTLARLLEAENFTQSTGLQFAFKEYVIIGILFNNSTFDFDSPFVISLQPNIEMLVQDFILKMKWKRTTVVFDSEDCK